MPFGELMNTQNDENYYCTSSGSPAEMQQVIIRKRKGGLDIAGGLKEALNNGISKQAQYHRQLFFSNEAVKI
jgi:hypothetical protein